MDFCVFIVISVFLFLSLFLSLFLVDILICIIKTVVSIISIVGIIRHMCRRYMIACITHTTHIILIWYKSTTTGCIRISLHFTSTMPYRCICSLILFMQLWSIRCITLLFIDGFMLYLVIVSCIVIVMQCGSWCWCGSRCRCYFVNITRYVHTTISRHRLLFPIFVYLLNSLIYQLPILL